ncbi:cell division suppressor protein YneA [Jeotgalibacillus haloalkalitolerans]|uniref:LysM peptidoglycan-binding domain-containing protein n=1 Tax=Jeotgalibacillus haloalkalitolerans TaxID=3104292 RepID=A0ABU5KKW8_9BACL|nr:LysM peptidoglycan-binding domain-containing protein [Jeotgalibacillus sp. HH7-29]MDZ5711820.1 LysM peptidoglycan-binding domain-containing protein [Jeotgalibacillus sp. HH7-29]
MTALWRKYSFVILFVVTALFFSLFLVFTNTANSDATYAAITVKNGDTLWAYAEEYASHTSMTPEKFIEWVTEHNELSSHVIVAGEQLELPVPEEAFDFSEDAIHLASEQK